MRILDTGCFSKNLLFCIEKFSAISSPLWQIVRFLICHSRTLPVARITESVLRAMADKFCATNISYCLSDILVWLSRDSFRWSFSGQQNAGSCDVYCAQFWAVVPISIFNLHPTRANRLSSSWTQCYGYLSRQALQYPYYFPRPSVRTSRTSFQYMQLFVHRNGNFLLNLLNPPNRFFFLQGLSLPLIYFRYLGT